MATNEINDLERDEFELDEVSDCSEFETSPTAGDRRFLCRVRYQKVLRTRTVYGGLQLLFQISEPGHPLDGQPVICFFNAPKGAYRRAGEIIWPPGSKYAKAWILANGGTFPRRWDRLTPKKFTGKVFEAELVETGKGRQLDLVAGANGSYARDYKVNRLLRQIPDEDGAGTELVHYKDSTEVGQKADTSSTGGMKNPASAQGKEAMQTRKRDIYKHKINNGTGICLTPARVIRASPPGRTPEDQSTGVIDRWGAYGIILDSIELDDAGKGYSVCPQCSAKRKKDTAKCLSVNTVYGTWKCFHCLWTGNLSVGVKVPSIMQFQTHADTIEEGLRLSLPVLEKGNERQALLAFMAQRGIDEAIVDRNGVELRIDRQGRGWINFPYRRDGEYVYTKSRRYDKKEFRHYVEGAYPEKPNITPILYNEDVLRKEPDWIVMVEGELDALAVQTAGIEQVVSVPTGAGAKNCDWLAGVITEFQGLQRVVLAVDRDGPGRELAETLKGVLDDKVGPGLCQEINWEDVCDCREGPGCKDANDVLLKHGGDRLVQGITEAAMKNREVLV